MKTKDLQQLTEEQLRVKLSDCQNKLQEANEAVWSGQEKNVRLVRELRRDCARAATVLRQKIL